MGLAACPLSPGHTGSSAHLLAVSSGFSAGAEGEEGEPPPQGVGTLEGPLHLRGQVRSLGDS